MMRAKVLGFWGMVPFLCSALLGQVEVRLETPKSAYLQYAQIPFTICLKNIGGEEIAFESAGNKPWLEMIVQSRDGLLIRSEKPFVPPDKNLKVGESAVLPVDLASYFLVREPGGYQARASVRLPSGQTLLTEPLAFLIGRGETIWTQNRGEGVDRHIYSLLKFYEDPNVGLYLRVEVPEKNIVYPSRRLGPYVPLTKPMVEFDAQNHLHLLYQTAAGVHRITVVSEDGRLLREETRQEGVDKPTIRKEKNGEVVTEGGNVILPGNLRERLSTLQARIGATVPAAEKN
ncbi:MAG: hypothetical protein EB090_00940 [Verrucomicrobia bacterium]|nr:hypothetical protein [Verrucomicrobiota bacterium]